MPKITIGKRVPIENIRTIWEKESNFSDWLATPEGLELIAQDLEIQIENPIREGKGTNFLVTLSPIYWEKKNTL